MNREGCVKASGFLSTPGTMDLETHHTRDVGLVKNPPKCWQEAQGYSSHGRRQRTYGAANPPVRPR